MKRWRWIMVELAASAPRPSSTGSRCRPSICSTRAAAAERLTDLSGEHDHDPDRQQRRRGCRPRGGASGRRWTGSRGPAGRGRPRRRPVVTAPRRRRLSGSSSGGVAGGRRTIRARVADAAAACQLASDVTGELSRPRGDRAARLRQFEHPCYFEAPACAPTPPPIPRPSSPACSRSRRSPAGSSTTPSSRPRPAESRRVPDLAGPADRRRARRRAGSSVRTRHQAEAIDAVHAGEDVVDRDPDRVGQDAVLRAARRSRPSPTTRRRGRCSSSPPRRSARTR